MTLSLGRFNSWKQGIVQLCTIKLFFLKNKKGGKPEGTLKGLIIFMLSLSFSQHD